MLLGQVAAIMGGFKCQRIILWVVLLFSLVSCGRPRDAADSDERKLVPLRTAQIRLDRRFVQSSFVNLEEVEVTEAAVDPELEGLAGAVAYTLRSATMPPTYVLEVGDTVAGLPPLVLVHGLGIAGVRDFYPVLESLSADRRVIAIELPGIGRSSLGLGRPHPEAFAQRVSAVVAARVEGEFDLLGHSLGGAVALLVAAGEKERLRRLVLVDVAGVLHQDAFVGSQIEWLSRDAGMLGTGSARTLKLLGRQVVVVSQWLRPSDESIAWGTELLTGVQAQTAIALIQLNLGAALRAQSAPTLIVWGTLDNVAPLRTAELLSSRISRSELQLFEGVGHVPMLDVPDEFSRRVDRFLRKEIAPAAAEVVPAPVSARCSSEQGLVYTGRFSSLILEDCSGIVLDQVMVDRLIIRDSEVDMSRSTITDGIEATESEIRITGGRISGQVALWLAASQADVAGSVLRGSHAAVQSRGESDFLGSAVLIEGPRGEAAVHGHVVLSDGEGF